MNSVADFQVLPEHVMGVAWGRTWHERLRPVRRRFAYPVLFVWLPMRAWRRSCAQAPGFALPRNRFGILSFADRDHGQGGVDALAWMEQVLREAGVHDADGEIWLQTLPRVFGFAFKPVSFWFAHRADGALRAVLVEVNNTFGERHCYLLQVPVGVASKVAVSMQARKVFHVSPFCDVAGHYEFRFMHKGDCRLARIDLHDDVGPLIRTSLVGTVQPYRRAVAWQVLWRAPWAALAVLVRIHWQALLLWRRKLPFFRQPSAPSEFVT